MNYKESSNEYIRARTGRNDRPCKWRDCLSPTMGSYLDGRRFILAWIWVDVRAVSAPNRLRITAHPNMLIFPVSLN